MNGRFFKRAGKGLNQVSSMDAFVGGHNKDNGAISNQGQQHLDQNSQVITLPPVGQSRTLRKNNSALSV